MCKLPNPGNPVSRVNSSSSFQCGWLSACACVHDTLQHINDFVNKHWEIVCTALNCTSPVWNTYTLSFSYYLSSLQSSDDDDDDEVVWSPETPTKLESACITKATHFRIWKCFPSKLHSWGIHNSVIRSGTLFCMLRLKLPIPDSIQSVSPEGGTALESSMRCGWLGFGLASVWSGFLFGCYWGTQSFWTPVSSCVSVKNSRGALEGNATSFSVPEAGQVLSTDNMKRRVNVSFETNNMVFIWFGVGITPTHPTMFTRNHLTQTRVAPAAS